MAVTDYVAAYRLASTADQTGSFNLTNNNSVTFGGTGKIGNAAEMGTTNTNKSLSTANTLGISSGDIGISYWYYTGSSVNNFPGSLQLRKNGGFSFGMIFDQANSRVCGCNDNFVSCSGIGTYPVSTNTWYYITINRDSSGNCELYVNNVLVVSFTNPTTGSTDSFNIGNYPSNSWFSSGLFNLCFVYNHLLDGTDRAALYNGGAGYDPSVSTSQNSNFLSFM